ncbi:hypothetical protein DL93DRAFT_2229131 [Clavulina sp. PMI_390]|nr:hypothetical protein DL93DRAFT_2229131 [Clavulina sp. PMI_390]
MIVTKFLDQLMQWQNDQNKVEAAAKSLDLSLIEAVIDRLTSIKTTMKNVEAIIINQLTRVTCQYSSVLNTQNTTIKLPVELLGTIFSHACDVTPTISRKWWDESGISSNTVNHTRLSIELTCAHWRTVLHSTPDAWKNVIFASSELLTSDTPQSDVQMMFAQLQRSKSPKRHIFVDTFNMSDEALARIGLMDRLWHIFTHERSFMETLAIRAARPLDLCTSWLFNKPVFPLLRTLRVEWGQNRGPMVLDLSGATQLQTLILSHSINLDDHNITLSVLCPDARNISDLHFHGSISMVDAFRIIAQNAGTLQNLHWEACLYLTSDVFPNEKPLSFPKLQKLLLGVDRPDLLFDNHAFPSLETLIFGSPSTDRLNKDHLPMLRFLKLHYPDRSSLLNYLSENQHIEQICFYSFDEATLQGLIPLISRGGSDESSSFSAQGARDPLPNLEFIYTTKWDAVASIEKLLAACRRRRRPIIIIISTSPVIHTSSEGTEKPLDVLLQEYPDVLQHGPLPSRFRELVGYEF